MPCEFLNDDNVKKFARTSYIWVLIPLRKMARECLDISISIITPCYVLRLNDSWLVAVNSLFLKEAKKALKRCVEIFQQDIEFAEALASGKKPDSYPQFEKEVEQYVKALREYAVLENEIKNLSNRRYRLAEIEFSDSWEVEERIADELKRINPDIEFDNLGDYVVFKYRGKTLRIGEVTLEHLLESVYFVVSEGKAVKDILTAVRRASPEYADELERAVEKLKLFKKMLDKTVK